MQPSFRFLKPENENTNIKKLRNIMLTISYDGSNYHGWQIQKNALTVQEVFQNALFKIIKENTDIKGCSRTDTGVHAKMYVISFKTHSRMLPENLVLALNKLLPNDIAVLDGKEVSSNFHARYSCSSKEYIYKIWHSRIKNPFLSNRALHYWYPLDIQELSNAAKYFVGAHNFTSFCAQDKRKMENMIRNIEYFEVYRSKDDENMVEFKVKADGFLYNMVRIMIGTLLRVAQGKIKKEDIPKIIEYKDRSKAGPTVPAEGLYLNKLFYENNEVGEKANLS